MQIEAGQRREFVGMSNFPDEKRVSDPLMVEGAAMRLLRTSSRQRYVRLLTANKIINYNLPTIGQRIMRRLIKMMRKCATHNDRFAWNLAFADVLLFWLLPNCFQNERSEGPRGRTGE